MDRQDNESVIDLGTASVVTQGDDGPKPELSSFQQPTGISED